MGFATVWFAAFCAIFFRDPNYPLGEVGAAGVVGAAEVLLLALWPAIIFSRQPFEVALGDDGVCEFRAPLRRRRVRAQQIKSIKGDEEDFDFVLRYKGGRVRLEGEDFLGFLTELVELNPAIRIDIGEGWVRRVLYERRAGPVAPPPDAAAFVRHVGPGGADWIRQFREPYSESRRRQDRIDRIYYSVLILFIWFWFSFMSWGLSFAFFDPHSRLAWAAQFVGAASFGVLAAVVWFRDDRPELSRLFRRAGGGRYSAMDSDRRREPS